MDNTDVTILFGEILADLRVAKGLDQTTLAKIISVKPPTISNYENGHHYPNIKHLLKIADYFNTSLDYLLGRINVNLDYKKADESFALDINTNQPLTIGELINTVSQLDESSRRELLTFIDYLLKRTH